MGEAATCKGTEGSSRFAEVMALKIALERVQKHHWPKYMYIQTPGWWLMPCGNVSKTGKALTGSSEQLSLGWGEEGVTV